MKRSIFESDSLEAKTLKFQARGCNLRKEKRGQLIQSKRIVASISSESGLEEGSKAGWQLKFPDLHQAIQLFDGSGIQKMRELLAPRETAVCYGYIISST